MRIANLIRVAALAGAGALVASGASCGAANSNYSNNYSKTPCFDNCGNDTQCQASCQQLGQPGTQVPISTQSLGQPR
jgi:hypothetical protein